VALPAPHFAGAFCGAVAGAMILTYFSNLCLPYTSQNSTMSKPKLTDFKKYVANLNEAGLREELFKLFGKLPQVQEFYAQELMSDAERKAMLEEYKKKVQNQFWTRTGNPRNPSNAELRTLLTNFQKVSVFPTEVIDLFLYRVEMATEFANDFGGMSDADYNASITAFKKAIEMMVEHKLGEQFRSRCEALFRLDNLDYWYTESLEELFNEHF
jgi:hypothetical protein